MTTTPPEYIDDTYHSIAQIWANKHVGCTRRLPVPAGNIDVREANAVQEAERQILDLARSACAKVARDTHTGPTAPPKPTEDEVRDMAAAIAAEVLNADEGQARVDRTVYTNLCN